MTDLRLARFALVGLTNTVIGLAVIYSCMSVAGWGEMLSNFVGYSTALAFSFVFNKNWTFGYSGEWRAAFVRYLLVLSLAYIANLAMVIWAIEVLALDSYSAQALGTGPYAAIGYVGSRLFAFPNQQPESCS